MSKPGRRWSTSRRPAASRTRRTPPRPKRPARCSPAQVSPMIYCGTWCANIFIAEGFDNFAMFRFPAVEGGKGDPGAGFLVPQGFMVSAKTAASGRGGGMGELPRLGRDGGQVRRGHGRHPVQRQADRHRCKGTEQYKWIVSDIAAATGSVMVLDVLLEASVSNAYLDAGVEILNGTKTPQQAMDVHPRRGARSQGQEVGSARSSRARSVRTALSPRRGAGHSTPAALRESDARRHRRQSRDVRRPAPGPPLDVGQPQARR